MQNTLQTSPSHADAKPNGRDMNNSAGTNTKDTINNAAVVVYWLPVRIWLDSSMVTTSWVVWWA
jgi:hypothetical protein